eukprot:CAMPEP_0184290302 /NCGR_PEP_ID=MMETSP1049-20130417/2608_1 /TAXON_ID=77928 /ORGANISM="Proteomonas sulcata, Strain CCMP704" /LENGTH=90 /DNA_ID=CAMNT_0026597437 /DNA_START=240 /DNA_END=512 /DNA_ORIENTATION=-
MPSTYATTLDAQLPNPLRQLSALYNSSVLGVEGAPVDPVKSGSQISLPSELAKASHSESGRLVADGCPTWLSQLQTRCPSSFLQFLQVRR